MSASLKPVFEKRALPETKREEVVAFVEEKFVDERSPDVVALVD